MVDLAGEVVALDLDPVRMLVEHCGKGVVEVGSSPEGGGSIDAPWRLDGAQLVEIGGVGCCEVAEA